MDVFYLENIQGHDSLKGRKCGAAQGELYGKAWVRRMPLTGGKSSKFLQTGQADETNRKVAKSEIIEI